MGSYEGWSGMGVHRFRPSARQELLGRVALVVMGLMLGGVGAVRTKAGESSITKMVTAVCGAIVPLPTGWSVYDRRRWVALHHTVGGKFREVKSIFFYYALDYTSSRGGDGSACAEAACGVQRGEGCFQGQREVGSRERGGVPASRCPSS